MGHRPRSIFPDGEFTIPNGPVIEDPIFQTVADMQREKSYPWLKDTRYERTMLMFWASGQDIAAMDWLPNRDRGMVALWSWREFRHLVEHGVLVPIRFENTHKLD